MANAAEPALKNFRRERVFKTASYSFAFIVMFVAAPPSLTSAF
jgi:hypothetical protein